MSIKKFIGIICFLLVTVVYAQQEVRMNTIENQLELLKVEESGLSETIEVNISQTTLSNFLLAIAKVHDININVATELSNIPIVNNFSNVTVANTLLFLVKEYGLDIEFTGNILSIKKYTATPAEPSEDDLKITYSIADKTLSLDLRDDPLELVFRRIMDLSGKNILFTPEAERIALSIYIKDVPFDLALSKLAETNHLVLNTSKDGFYLFDTPYTSTAGKDDMGAMRSRRSRSSNFKYQIIDTLQKRVSVQLQNTPIAEVIYNLSDDLNLDIFTAAPLESAGTATVEATDIEFDVLLANIFESVIRRSSGDSNSAGTTTNFTFKKEGDMYFFGTEDQLSLKQIEVIQLMNRSVQLMENPSGNGRRASRNPFSFPSPNGFAGNNTINNGNQLRNGNQNQQNSSGGVPNLTSIEDIIPEELKDGIEIKLDAELNSLIVSGPGVKVERLKDFIKFIDKKVPFILIEVMILEVSKSAVVETGVSFGLGNEPSQTVGSVFPNTNIRVGAKDANKIIGNFNGFGSLNIGKVVPEFFLDIKAMESNGDIKVLSTPKITTINSHKAYLSSGQTSYYAVTTQNLIGTQNPINSEVTNYFPIDAELAIEIMPFVSGDGDITMDIQVIQSSFNGERIAEDAPPGIDSREFSSIIRMKDQDVAILGGIEEVRKDDSGSGVPLLARIPLIKYLFSKRRREDSKRKLNILIKPTVIQ